MKVAKLEIKMIVAMFVVGYEYDVVDSKGRVSDKLPIPDYNDIQQVRTLASQFWPRLIVPVFIT